MRQCSARWPTGRWLILNMIRYDVWYDMIYDRIWWYDMLWLRFVLATICLGYELSWVRVVLGTSCPGYELSWVQVVLGTGYLGYELYWARVVLGTSCPWYELSWVRVVLGTGYLGYELYWVRVVLGTSCLGYELSRSHNPIFNLTWRIPGTDPAQNCRIGVLTMPIRVPLLSRTFSWNSFREASRITLLTIT